MKINNINKSYIIFSLLLIPNVVLVRQLPFIEHHAQAACVVCGKVFLVTQLQFSKVKNVIGFVCKYCLQEQSKGKGEGCSEPGAPKIPWDRTKNTSYEESQAALEYAWLYEKEFGKTQHNRVFTVGDYTITLPPGFAAGGIIKNKRGLRRFFRIPKVDGRFIQITDIISLSGTTALVKTKRDDLLLKYDIQKDEYKKLEGIDLARAALADIEKDLSKASRRVMLQSSVV